MVEVFQQDPNLCWHWIDADIAPDGEVIDYSFYCEAFTGPVIDVNCNPFEFKRKISEYMAKGIVQCGKCAKEFARRNKI